MTFERSPAFQFYPKDFLSDSHVVAMTLAERGAYITLLCLCWMDRTLPVELAALARLCRVPTNVFARLWPALEPCFTVVSGRLVQPRIERERRKQETYRALKAEAGRKGGSAKASGKQKPSKAIAESSPPSSSSSPSSVSDPKKEREPQHGNGAARNVSLSSDPFLDDEITERAGHFVRAYEALYPKCRYGARYAVKPARDYASAVALCQTWTDDERLLKLARIFLTTDHKFAAEGSRTITQFLGLASWCDSRLAEVEAEHA